MIIIVKNNQHNLSEDFCKYYFKDTAESFGKGSSQQSVIGVSTHFSCNFTSQLV